MARTSKRKKENLEYQNITENKAGKVFRVGIYARLSVDSTEKKNESPPELAVVAAHLTSLSRGFRIGNTVYSVFKARKKTPLTYQEVSGANVLPLTEIFSNYFS